MTHLQCPSKVVDETLEALREGGRAGVERVVFWLGSRTSSEAVISEIYLPQQEAEKDYFRIPPDSMIELMHHLRRRRLVLLAQVHSHPGMAFHSEADDRWAVVRHGGALSIVVPEFASKTTMRNFEKNTAVFRLTSDDRWQKVELTELSTFLSVI